MADSSAAKKHGACSLKQHYTSHWDLDALPREELEALMAKNVGGDTPGEPPIKATGEKQTQDNNDPDEADGSEEDPVKIGAILLAVSVLMLFVGWLILRMA